MRLRSRPLADPSVSYPICPRCGHYIPDDASPGDRPGNPTLRADVGDVLVCDACAWHETWLVTGKQDLAAEAWPVDVPMRFRRQIGMCGG